MRAIKFRVRDAKGNLIGYNRFDQGRWSCQMLKDGGGGEWSNGVLHGSHMDQYTGVEDKKATEIYEGDILQFKAWSSKRKGLVVWNEGAAGFELEMGPMTSTGFFRDPGRAYEVIGNIYENPELLKSAEDGK